MEPKDCHVIISIVTWNNEKYIADFFNSLREQTFQGYHVIVVDNASSDKSLELVPKEKNITIIRNSNNAGFSKGHNKSITLAMKFWQGKDMSDRYIIIANPDIIFEKTFLRSMLLAMHHEPKASMMSPKLLRVHTEEVDNLPQKMFSKVIDSVGIRITKSRKISNIGAGEADTNHQGLKKIFGVSGTLMCLRASILQKVAISGEYFDEDFFAYKEDADLSWRMNNLGHEAYINYDALSYHYRAIKEPPRKNIRSIFKNQKEKSEFVRFLSLRNHLWTIAKNDYASNMLKDLPFIFSRELGRFLYTLFFDIKNLKAYGSAIKGLPKILKKRQYLKNLPKRNQKFRGWLSAK